MWTSALVSFLHLLGVGLAIGSVFVRGRALAQAPFTDDARARAFRADNVWGISALLLLPTGALRAFAGLEKGFDFYGHSALFWTKLAVVALLLSAELWPMITLIRWRVALGKGRPIDTSRARTFAMISSAEAGAVVVIMALAAFMARGFLQVR